MRINKERLLQSNIPLIGFGSTKFFLAKSITLLVTIGTIFSNLPRRSPF